MPSASRATTSATASSTWRSPAPPKSVITYGTMKAWQALHVLSPEGCFPFAKKRNGTVLGEGAGILVLESLEHAKKRGRQDPGRALRLRHDLRQLRTWSTPISRARARPCAWRSPTPSLAPSDIDYLNAHGTATTINDTNETRAIKKVFGDHAKKLAISSTKSMHGHPLGAGGGIEAVACIHAIREGWVEVLERPARGRPRTWYRELYSLEP